MSARHVVATRRGNVSITEQRSGMSSSWGGMGGYPIMDPAAIPPPGFSNQQRAGVLVTQHSLLQVDVVFTALRIISNNIIKMGDLWPYKESLTDDNIVYREYQSKRPAILTDTFGGGDIGGRGGAMMQCTGRDRTVWSMALFGEAFWYVLERDSRVRPSCLEVLHPAFMEVKEGKRRDGTTGRVFVYGTGSQKQELDPDDVIQIPFKSLPQAQRALSPITYAGVAGALAMAAYEFGSTWFSQGAAPSFILSTDVKLGQEEVQRIASKFSIEHSGLGAAHLPLVLDNGLKAEKVMSSPDEAQYLHSVDLAEEILTTVGWKTMGTIETGDVVYAEDGSQTTVLGKSPVFLDSPCYELEFADGSKVVASDDHRWHVWDNYDHQRGGGYHGEWKTITTADIASNWKWYQDKNRYRVACDGVVQAPEADLPIDPYIFGYWLGDGTSLDPSLTVGHRDVEHVTAAIERAGYHVTASSDLTGGWGTSKRLHLSNGTPKGLRNTLRDLGVLGRGKKHIPDVYLQASVEQRKALLAGLLDSDGSAFPSVRFTSTLPRLADDVLTLVRSLGQRARITHRDLPPREGVKTSKRQAVIHWTATFDPFRMARKSAAVRIWEDKPRAKDVRRMSIVGVRRVKPRSTRCIKVDHPSHVFLIGRTFVPTGNTLEYARNVIASWFGLPPSLLGNALERQTPQPAHTSEEESTKFLQHTLSGYMVPLEEAHSGLLPQGVKAAFNENALAKPDAQFLAQLILNMRQSQVMSIDELRARYAGLGPLPNGQGKNALAPLASNTAPSQTQHAPTPSDTAKAPTGTQKQMEGDEKRALVWLTQKIAAYERAAVEAA